MSDPIEDLMDGYPLDEKMRKRIVVVYKKRGTKALEFVDQGQVKRYRDFFVVIGKSGKHVIEDEYCSCEDHLHRGGLCAHLLAVKIVRAIGRYELIDHWYYEDLKKTEE